MSDTSEPRPVGEALTELQRRLHRPGGAPIIPITQEDQDAALEAEVQALWAERWKRMVPRVFWDATLGDFPEDIAQIAGEWALPRPQHNLVIVGPYGTGKTHLACAAIRDWARRGMPTWFTSTSDLLAQMRPGGDTHAYTRATTVELLVLDDIGAIRDTEWTDEAIFRIVDARWREARPIVATTSLDLTALSERITERVYERLCLSGAVLVQLGGESRRRNR